MKIKQLHLSRLRNNELFRGMANANPPKRVTARPGYFRLSTI
jgi:hypothetical protein